MQEEKGLKRDDKWLELKLGDRLKLINGACMKSVPKDRMLVVTGKIGSKVVEVLRDTGCSGVIVERELVGEDQLTGEVGYMMAGDRTVTRAPLAKVHIDTPYLCTYVEQ